MRSQNYPSPAKTAKLIFLLLFLQVFTTLSLEARHIIGGEIVYKCLGIGRDSSWRRYQFTIKIYRDCYGGGAQFDDPANITIFRKNSFSQYDIIQNLAIRRSPVTPIGPPTNPCLILPPNVCVEEAEYDFTAELSVNETYVVSYQRCCRNNTITNLINPGDQGITYTAELTPFAIKNFDNSPVFKQFPPTVICLGEPIDFDHGATDADGDQLVYEFCSPLLGGGTDGATTPGNPNSCTGVMPNPACPPPYSNVIYQTPTYNPLVPMGGAPPIAINATTGLITGTPNVGGQFVVGVCVKAYRNGQLVGTLRRDFQFNVATCEPTVFAKIKADKVVNGKQFIVNSCGDSTVTFVNQSTLEQYIREYVWRFNIKNDTQVRNTKDATVTFPGIGSYSGTMILNPGTRCSDTATINVNVFPAIRSDFTFTYDTCVAGPVSFTDKSFSGSGKIDKWNWSFGDGSNDTVVNPIHPYQKPGKFNVTLSVTDKNACTAQRIREVNWFPVPPLIIIEPSEFVGCVPASIFFNNLSKPIDNTYKIEWDFGDGEKGYDISPTHEYKKPGTYTVKVDITSPLGCKTASTFNDLITIEPSPVAGFTYSPTKLNSFNRKVDFTDQSKGAAAWLWRFDTLNRNFSRLQNPSFEFRDTGLQRVIQIVTHASGCKDTAIALLDIEPAVTYFMPNAFTPNNDNINEFFLGKGYLVGISNFKMTIWNRWGELVFETNNPEEGWNGRKNNTGDMSPDGMYAYTVTFRGPRGQPFEFKGLFTLLK